MFRDGRHPKSFRQSVNDYIANGIYINFVDYVFILFFLLQKKESKKAAPPFIVMPYGRECGQINKSK